MAGDPFGNLLMKIHFNDPLFEAWTQRPILTIAEGRRDRRDQGDGGAHPRRRPRRLVSRMDGDRRPTLCPGRRMRHARCADQRALPLSAGVNVLPHFLSAVVRPADRSPRQVRLCTRGRGFCPRRGVVRSADHTGESLLKVFREISKEVVAEIGSSDDQENLPELPAVPRVDHELERHCRTRSPE